MGCLVIGRLLVQYWLVPAACQCVHLMINIVIIIDFEDPRSQDQLLCDLFCCLDQLSDLWSGCLFVFIFNTTFPFSHCVGRIA